MIVAAVALFVNAGFNALVWPQFFRRIARDPRARGQDGRATAFYRVHLVLVSIALLIAVASAAIGVWLLTGA